MLSEHIEHVLNNSSTLSATQIFMYASDQALFKSLFFAGDRAADLLQLKMTQASFLTMFGLNHSDRAILICLLLIEGRTSLVNRYEVWRYT